MEDVLLIKNCIQGCQRSQTRLYNRYWRTMYTWIQRYIDDTELAQEICNSGFVRVFSKLQLFSNSGSFEGWIRKIMSNEVSNYVNGDSRVINGKKYLYKGYTKNILYNIDGEMRENLFSIQADSNLHVKDINKLINLIPNKKCLNAFKLFIDGYSHKEIAEMLDTTEGTSKWYISDARNFIQKQLKLNKNA